jgi:hypothetical protein
MDNVLKGKLGFKGERGFSAYEIAVQNGYVGTEKDWLSNLGTTSKFERDVTIYTATTGQTEFDLPSSYVSGSFIDIYVEGERLSSEEYAINEGKIVLTNAITVEGTKIEAVVTIMSTNELPIIENLTESSTNDTVLGAGSLFNLLATNVKNFGAVGDGVANDTQAFQKAIDYMNEKGIFELYIPKGTYLLDALVLNENTIVYGCGSTLNVLMPEEVGTVAIKSNSYVRDLTINSLNEDRRWSRVDMTDQSNITIENCTITGFRNPTNQDAWGLYMKKSKNITIKGCMFDNNTQADIAMTEDTENVVIENCKALNSYFKINSEPNGTGIVRNVTIKNNNISLLTIVGNSPSVYNNQNFMLYDNIIDELMLQNATCELVNNYINNIRATSFSNQIFRNINSIGLGKDLNNDVQLVNIQPSSSENTDCWKMGYTSGTNAIKRASSTKGKTLVCNPNLDNIACSVERYFEVAEGETYAIKCLMNTKHPANTSVSGRGLNVFFYNDSDTKLSEIKFIIDRTNIDLTTGGETDYTEKTVFLTIPEGSTKMRVLLSNYTTSNGVFATNWGKVNIQKISLIHRYIHESDESTTGTAIPERISAFGDNYLGIKGDVIYLTNGVSYAAVCTESGNPGTWKKIMLSEEV